MSIDTKNYTIEYQITIVQKNIKIIVDTVNEIIKLYNRILDNDSLKI